MAKNNMTTNIVGTTMDIVRISQRNIEASKKVDINKQNAAIDEINKTIELMHGSRYLVKDSDHMYINENKNTWKKKKAKGDIDPITEKLRKLTRIGDKKTNFFEIIGNKKNNSEEMLGMTIKNLEIIHSKQRGKANESINSWKESYKHYNSIKSNGGSLFVWDLETIGGKDTNDIWRPTGITEFAVQEYDAKTGKALNNINVLLGLSDKNKKETVEKIKKAIENGTLDSNEELKVTAMRLAKYADKDFKYEKVAGEDFFKAINFPSVDRNNYKDINVIERGANVLNEVYHKTGMVDGIKADVHKVVTSLNNIKISIANEKGILTGYNSTMFDEPIMNSMLLKWDQEYKGAISKMFADNKASFTIPSHANLDIFGGIKLATDHNNIASIYGNAKIGDIEKIRGQEYLLQKHYGKAFIEEGLKPHKAEDDVTGLSWFLTKKSESLPGNVSVVEHINNLIEDIKTEDNVLIPGKHIIQAKKGVRQNIMGRDYFNFAQSNSTGTIYTADNHLLGNGDEALKNSGNAMKESFSAGFGINKGSFYNISNIREIDLTDELRTMLGDISPEYSGNKLFQLQLEMVVHDDFKYTSRQGDLTQNLIFKSKKELNSFLSGNFDIVAEKTDEGVKIKKGMEDVFDIREVNEDKNTNLVSFKPITKENLTDEELFNRAIIANNEKLAISRANNAMFGDKSYSKIKQILELQNNLSEKLDMNITGRDIALIMSERISKGQMAMELGNEQLATAQEMITKALSHDKNNVKRLLQSTIDNNATGLEMINSYGHMFKNVINALESTEVFKSAPLAVKQELFNRTVKEVKSVAAEWMFNNKFRGGNDALTDMMKLGDVKLQTSLLNLKNMYEVRYDKIVRGKRINFIDASKTLETANILKVNLDDVNSPYSIIKSATEAVHGNSKKGNLLYEKDAVEKLFTVLQEDENLKDTMAFKNIKKQFKFSPKNNFKDKDFHPYQIAEAIIQGMKESKEKNITNGIVNGSRTFMKALEAHPEFARYLNAENMDKVINKIANNIVDKTYIGILDGGKDSSERFAKNLIEKYYMPNKEILKGNKTKNILYDNLYKDLHSYVTEVIHTADELGASISVQKNGSLLINKNGRSEELLMPKIKYDDPSDIMYLELGSMKLQVNNKLIFKTDGQKIKGDTASSLNILNEFSISNNVKRVVEKKGENEGLDRLVGLVSLNNAAIRKGSTINGFGGNDIDSNNSVDISNIKKVLVDLFGENQKLNHLMEDINFVDSEFLSNMKDYLKYNIKSGKELKDISPEMTRDLIKNIGFILEKIRNDGNITKEFAYLSEGLGFTGQEKKVSKFIGVKGYRPINSTLSIFDNAQRPPVTQSGNALQLRIDDIKKSKTGITPGNIISSDMMDARTMRYYHGLGNTTTDVMMDTTYVSNNALQIILDNNFKKVIEDANVDEKTKNIQKRAYDYIRNSISTFEQERVIDSRVHEEAFGLKTAATQKLSKNYDTNILLNELSENDLKKQQDALLNYRGTFEVKEGKIIYSSSPGKLVNRGESAVKWKGFADRNADFTSKMHYGVFNFNFYESDGTKLRDEDINKIINKNSSLFFNKDKPLTQAEMVAKLEDLLSKKNIIGQYAIEDVSAIGYVKTMTSGVEKGMTDILYTSTGSYNKKVKQFFKETGTWDIVNSKVITNETIDAIFFKNEDLSKKALEKTGFKSLKDLKKAINVERNIHSALLFDKILQGKTHLLANDAIEKHGNIGQMYEGLLSKAINSLTKKYGDQTKAVEHIVNKINSEKEFQFIEQYDLAKGIDSLKTIGVKQKNSKFYIDNKFYNIDKSTALDKDKFSALIKSIDKELEGLDESDRLITKDIYIMNKDGKYEYKKEIIGSYITTNKDLTIDGKFVKNAKVALGSNTRENVKYTRDSETQSSVTAEYFEMQKTKKSLRKEKIELEKEMITSNNATQKSAIQQKIMKIDSMIEDIDSQLGSMKTMKFGDQELSILERVSLTEAHVKQIQKMINNGEVNTDVLLESHAFKTYLKKTTDGNVEFSDKIVGEKALEGLINQFKEDQFFNPYTDDLLTKEMVTNDKKYAHLKNIFEYADKYNIKIGVQGAEKEYKIQNAMKANSFNKGYAINIEEMKNKGFEVMHIDDVNFNLDDLVEKDIIVDLGENFTEGKRYVAVPGTGMKIADEEIRSEGHKKLNKLKHSIEELNEFGGNKDNEDYKRAFQKVMKNREETIEGVKNTIFNKHGMHHNASKLEVNAVSYRLKSSGIVADTATKELVNTAKEAGIDVTVGDNLTKKSKIMGRTIADWEANGEAYFDYKYVSRQKMNEMGYYKPETLKKFGFSTEEEMDKFLSEYGTFDITDRYPNIRNESIVPTRVFLDKNLQGNQTKISVSAMLKMKADQDGDLESSFRVEYRDKDGSIVDGALYELANKNGGRQYAIDNNIMSGEVYDYFAAQERAMYGYALTDNKIWQNDAAEIIKKDFIKNQNLSNPDNMVLVPNGQSILGRKAVIPASHLPSEKDYNIMNEKVLDILKMAKEVSNDDKFNIENINELKNTGEVLDQALTTIKGTVDDKTFRDLEATAIKKVTIDKYAQEMMSKTGLAATGSINQSLNAVRLAQVFRDTSPEKATLSNYVWNVLGIAEQGVISSKKDKGETYNDNRIKNFKEAMNKIFNRKQNVAPQEALNDLGNWLDEYGDNIFEKAYENMGHVILNKEQRLHIENQEDSLKAGAKVMKEEFLNTMKEMSYDKLALSYKASIEATGRNGASTEKLWYNGSIGAAAERADTLSGRHQALMGMGDSIQLNKAMDEIAQRELRKQQNNIIKSNLIDTNNNDSEIKYISKEFTESLSESIKNIRVGGIGKSVLGLAAGLMIGGYASGNPLNDKQASEVNKENSSQPQQVMSIPEFMEKDSGYVTGNTQQGYIINIKADTRKGRKYMEKIMTKAAEATVGGAVNINMNIKNKQNQPITDRDIENYINRHF